MESMLHSVTLDKEKCKGCTNCIKQCPTEAIRVSKGKALITSAKCIDCGVCISVCPHNAKKAIVDKFDVIKSYKYKIALPAPTLYGQFKNRFSVNFILNALTSLGFDEVYEVAKGAEIVSFVTRNLLLKGDVKKPVISSSCPAILKLIKTKFHGLIDNVLKVDAPMEVVAKMARLDIVKKLGLDPKEIGIFFITPCAAKYTAIKAPMGQAESQVDGAIAVSEIVSLILRNLDKIEITKEYDLSGFSGINWANSGGEGMALKTENILAVDGIHNVITILNEIEDDKLSDIDFVETMACYGGCIGGPLNFENIFVAKANLKEHLLKARNREIHYSIKELEELNEKIKWTTNLTPIDIYSLGENILIASKMLNEINQIYNKLPLLDCGACGAPSCRALAEDIVKGIAKESDCIFILREKILELASEMTELGRRLPQALNNDNR